MIKQVGITKVKDTKTKSKVRTLCYADVEDNLNSWVSADEYRPKHYDIVYLKTAKDKIFKGWINNFNNWDGLRLKSNDVIVCWKKELLNRGTNICH